MKITMFIVSLVVSALLMASCTDKGPSTTPAQTLQKKSFSCVPAEIQKAGQYYLDLEITPSCRAVHGERSSSCCQLIRSFVLRVVAPDCVQQNLSVGENLFDYDLSSVPFLKITSTENIERITVLNKGNW
jgi:hypothetical protein